MMVMITIEEKARGEIACRRAIHQNMQNVIYHFVINVVITAVIIVS